MPFVLCPRAASHIIHLCAIYLTEPIGTSTLFVVVLVTHVSGKISDLVHEKSSIITVRILTAPSLTLPQFVLHFVVILVIMVFVAIAAAIAVRGDGSIAFRTAMRARIRRCQA